MTDTETKKPQIFEESSQYQHWRFSPEQLWDIRNKSTNEAISRVKKNVQEEQVRKKYMERFTIFTYILGRKCRKRYRIKNRISFSKRRVNIMSIL